MIAGAMVGAGVGYAVPYLAWALVIEMVEPGSNLLVRRDTRSVFANVFACAGFIIGAALGAAIGAGR